MDTLVGFIYDYIQQLILYGFDITNHYGIIKDLVTNRGQHHVTHVTSTFNLRGGMPSKQSG